MVVEIKNLTPNPFPRGKGNQIVGSNPFPSGKGTGFMLTEQSSALRATLRLTLGAGVTPAQGSLKPTVGFIFN
jgi:hypothetical protein